jgi:hypothetical protein
LGNGYDLDVELPHFRAAEQRWQSPLDQRCIRFWLLGSIWECIEIPLTDMDPIAEWFDDLMALPVCERERPRRMWHDRAGQAAYDRIQAERFTLHRGPTSDDLIAKFTYQEALSDEVLFRQTRNATSFERPDHDGNLVVTRLFNKASIIGVTESKYLNDTVKHYAVTPRWANSGLCLL